MYSFEKQDGPCSLAGRTRPDADKTSESARESDYHEKFLAIPLVNKEQK